MGANHSVDGNGVVTSWCGDQSAQERMRKTDTLRKSTCMIRGAEDSNWFLRGRAAAWPGEGRKRLVVEAGSAVVLHFHKVLVG